MGRTTTSSDFMKQLRFLVLDMRVGGIIQPKPIGRYVKKELDSLRVKFARDLVYVVTETDYTSEETKVYLSNPYINYAGVSDEIGVTTGEKPNKSTVQTRIWNDKTKLVKLFGDRCILDIVEYTSADISEQMNKMAELMVELKKNDILDKIHLNLDKSTEFCDSITDEEFDEFIDVISPYTDKYIRAVESNVNKRVVNYLRYIQANTDNNEKDAERLKSIKQLLT